MIIFDVNDVKRSVIKPTISNVIVTTMHVTHRSIYFDSEHTPSLIGLLAKNNFCKQCLRRYRKMNDLMWQ